MVCLRGLAHSPVAGVDLTIWIASLGDAVDDGVLLTVRCRRLEKPRCLESVDDTRQIRSLRSLSLGSAMPLLDCMTAAQGQREIRRTLCVRVCGDGERTELSVLATGPGASSESEPLPLLVSSEHKEVSGIESAVRPRARLDGGWLSSLSVIESSHSASARSIDIMVVTRAAGLLAGGVGVRGVEGSELERIRRAVGGNGDYEVPGSRRRERECVWCNGGR